MRETPFARTILNWVALPAVRGLLPCALPPLSWQKVRLPQPEKYGPSRRVSRLLYLEAALRLQKRMPYGACSASAVARRAYG
ncbi:MAG: hypothetical protein BCS36_03745 [Desulfovibrio sp. MES5]|nr:MAG: hypothetical protein BCS36_03745 [Desulfovibrio sp. MES5]